MKENEYLLLLSKRLSGEITPEEALQLEAWTQTSAENEQIAESFAAIWAKSETYGKTFQPDLSAAYQKVLTRIDAEPAPVLQVKYGKKWWQTAAAAALAILITAIAVWPLLSPDTPALVVLEGKSLLPQGAGLPDGTTCWIREGSQLKYAGAWDEEARIVHLSGEAYFSVKHNPAQPFKVILDNGGVVEVLGTQFDVCQTPGQTSVIVRTGKVKFTPKGTEGVLLQAQQKAVYDPEANTLKIIHLQSLNELAWQAGGLEFVNTPLQQVVEDLNTYYKVQIQLDNPGMKQCPHSAPLTNQPVQKVLEALALTHGLKIQHKGENAYVLKGGVCR